MFCKKVLTVSGESREVTCSFSIIHEKSFWISSLLYSYFSGIFQGFYLDFKLYCFDYILDFQENDFSKDLFFSPLHGGWPWYYTTADQKRDRGIIDSFPFKVARIFDKKFEHNAYGVK